MITFLDLIIGCKAESECGDYSVCGDGYCYRKYYMNKPKVISNLKSIFNLVGMPLINISLISRFY